MFHISKKVLQVVFFLNASLIPGTPKYFSPGGVQKAFFLLGLSETISSCRTEM